MRQLQRLAQDSPRQQQLAQLQQMADRHVAQHKHGRVAAKLQATGLAINDDAALESEADVMGQQALQMAPGRPASTESTLPTLGQVDASQVPIQLYTTQPNGLTVAGELHTKSDDHRQVEVDFARDVKNVEAGPRCYWEEPQMPGTGSMHNKPESSEHPDHFIAWDIDRMQHHYRLIQAVVGALQTSAEEPAVLDKVQAAQVALSAQSMLETLGFLKSDLQERDAGFGQVAKAYEGMAAEYTRIFNGLLAGGNAGVLDATLLRQLAGAKFPAALRTIDAQIAVLLPGLSETRKTSYDFTRTVAMNQLANDSKDVKGVWMVGEYHVQEIEEHLGAEVGYDLVSAHDFNADVKAFDGKRGGGAVQIDPLGELLTLSRKLAANLDYFVRGQDRTASATQRFDHWTRCMAVLFALEDLIEGGLPQAEGIQKRLPQGVTLQDVLALVHTIHQAMDYERSATEAMDPRDPEAVLPDDLYRLMRDEAVLKAAKDLNVLAGLAEFSST